MSIFPLRVHPSGRYFTDRFDNPFPLVAQSCWPASSNLPASSVAQWLATMKAQHFNSFIMEASNHNRDIPGGFGPSNRNGDMAFNTGTDGQPYTMTGVAGNQHADMSTPNDAYFNHTLDIINQADALDMLVVLYAFELGFAGSFGEGWAVDLQDAVNTNTVCFNFGKYMAQGNGGSFPGFAGCPNIIIQHGSDWGSNNSGNPPNSATMNKVVQIILGMLAGGCNQLAGGDWQAPSLATDQTEPLVWMQQNGIYSYGGDFPSATDQPGTLTTYTMARRAWNFVPTDARQGRGGTPPLALPGYMKETIYTGAGSGGPSTPADVRRAQYWCWLSGGIAGTIYGHSTQWMMLNLNNLVETGAADMTRFSMLLRDYPWWKLVPSELSGVRRLITSSNGTQAGTPSNYVAASQSKDGSLFMAFVPSVGTGTQTFTADFTDMAGALRLRWWDPTANKITEATGGNFSQAATSGVGMTTPGNNSAGDNDWILIGETATTPLLRPLVMGGGVSFAWR